MTHKSSTQKGTEFERKIYELLSSLIDSGKFILPSKQTKIFHKKKYYSAKRDKEIIFDVSMETSIENANMYSLLTLVECKGLKSPVSVDDIEEFSSKVRQIGEHNTKAIFISTNSFQESAYKYANSEGITLIRISSNDKFDWINYRKNSTNEDFNSIELINKFVNNKSPQEAFFCDYKNGRYTNFADLLIDLKIMNYFNDNIEFIKIPYVTTERIDFITEKLFSYDIFDNRKIDIDKLVNLLSERYKMCFEFDTIEHNDNILWKIEFNPLKISISNLAKADKNRWRFTIAHEIGHLVLHSKFLKERINNQVDDEFSLDLKKSISNKNIERLEVQANLFASHLLIPKIHLSYEMEYIFKKYRIHRRQLILDFQPVNQKEVYSILYYLSGVFDVSVAAIKYRLIELNLMVDKTNYKIKSILKNQFRQQ